MEETIVSLGSCHSVAEVGAEILESLEDRDAGSK